MLKVTQQMSAVEKHSEVLQVAMQCWEPLRGSASFAIIRSRHLGWEEALAPVS